MLSFSRANVLIHTGSGRRLLAGFQLDPSDEQQRHVFELSASQTKTTARLHLNDGGLIRPTELQRHTADGLTMSRNFGATVPSVSRAWSPEDNAAVNFA